MGAVRHAFEHREAISARKPNGSRRIGNSEPGCTRKLNGHYAYYGVNGNIVALRKLRDKAERAWQKWLHRRSQRARMYWKRFRALLERLPLPVPRIKVQIWKPRQLVLRL